jgi:hypothetical protein
VDHLALFPNLTHLSLSRDFETIANDQMFSDWDFEWCRRCFYRRFHATERILARCPRLTRCSWRQQPINNTEGHDYHYFLIMEDARGADIVRVVKPVIQWWMSDHIVDGGDLPEGIAEKKEYWATP